MRVVKYGTRLGVDRLPHLVREMSRNYAGRTADSSDKILDILREIELLPAGGIDVRVSEDALVLLRGDGTVAQNLVVAACLVAVDAAVGLEEGVELHADLLGDAQVSFDTLKPRVAFPKTVIKGACDIVVELVLELAVDFRLCLLGIVAGRGVETAVPGVAVEHGEEVGFGVVVGLRLWKKVGEDT